MGRTINRSYIKLHYLYLNFIRQSLIQHMNTVYEKAEYVVYLPENPRSPKT